MPVSDDEAKEVYEMLAGLLRSHELGWVVQQVEDRVRQGRAELRKVDVFEERLGAGAEGEVRRAKNKQTRTKIVPLSPQEALRVLLDATEQAIVVISRLERHALSAAIDAAPAGVVFLPDPEAGSPSEPQTPRRKLALDAQDAERRAPSAEKLARLLSELRAELPAVD